MIQPIAVTYQHTNTAYRANQFLAEIAKHPIIACDFEVAVKYTPEERTRMQSLLDTDLPFLERVRINSCLAATALDHPSHCTITHLSVAVSESDAYVFILDNARITSRVLTWLVTTTNKQVWHNASYDFKHIHYHTKRFPLDYEDSQLFAKCIVNHVDTSKALTGLKDLAGKWYGQWAISPDNFDISQMHDPKVLLYAATDACATYKLYHSIKNYITKEQECKTSSDAQ